MTLGGREVTDVTIYARDPVVPDLVQIVIKKEGCEVDVLNITSEKAMYLGALLVEMGYMVMHRKRTKELNLDVKK